MKLMDVLKQFKPKNPAIRQRIDAQYELTKSFIPEIEEARSYGYSWSQVCRAVEEIARGNGVWNEEWHTYDIEKNYRLIKKFEGLERKELA